MKLFVSLVLLSLASQIYGQVVVFSGFGSTSGTAGGSCSKQVDCPTSQVCRMPDFYNYPAMWPPCSHIGTCACADGQVLLTNNTCVSYINLALYSRCSNQIYEIVNTPSQRCDGSKVVCNTPSYVDAGGVCNPAPVPAVAVVPVVVNTPIVTCQTVGYLSACDSSKSCCDGSRGLSCQTKGPGPSYQQCLCSNKYHVYDQQLGYCRPRLYGDLCVENEECNTGLISNVGFECRFGRCRCQIGYEPVDNQFWNETARQTYTLRICVSVASTTWVPTGQLCTVNPHQVAQLNNTRVCHPRAFCHQCYRERSTTGSANTASAAVSTTGGSGTTAVAISGVCREFTCTGDSDCGFQGMCNRWNTFVDPPCDRGLCDCQWGNGFFKDRFSRCAPMRRMWLADRCILAANGLHNWYANNENWDGEKEVCAGSTSMTGMYAGYSWGVVKCKLPLVEDADGNCVRNDATQGILFNTVGYQQACDDTDLRLPRLVCDATKGLVCRNKVCQCPISASCSSSYAGCTTGVTTTTLIWDGNTCRARGYGDQCQSSTDCCGGTCINGVCGCPAGLTALDVATNAINNGDDVRTALPSSTKFCFRNYSLVAKGGECHLDPTSWNCGNGRYGWTNSYLPPLVCSPGLVCLRCPADYNTDDETHGLCRSVTPLNPPPGSCSQADLQSGFVGGPDGGNGGNGGSWGSGTFLRRGSNAATRFESSHLIIAGSSVLFMLAFV